MKINCPNMTICCPLLAVLLLANFALNALASSQPCADWEPFKNELCFKVFSAVELQTFEKAEKTCQENEATLIRIQSLERQQFLADFIFNRSKIVDNVWIGAQFAGGQFQWEDKSDFTYSNWAQGSPKKLAGYCVQLQSDIDAVGQWATEPCTKKNLVVCQKKASLSLAQMKELLFQLKRQLTDFSAATNQKQTQTENELANSRQQLRESQQNLADARQELANSIDYTKQELAKVKEALLKEVIPIGFIYVQLPKDKSPSEIWRKSLVWKDVSENYGGVFFRVQGGEAAPFGQVQACHAPRMEQIMSGDSGHVLAQTEKFDSPHDVPQVGWSNGFPTGGSWGGSIYTKFKFSDLTEVRPVNMAMKVWKRTA